jgi:hypothetical protein
MLYMMIGNLGEQQSEGVGRQLPRASGAHSSVYDTRLVGGRRRRQHRRRNALALERGVGVGRRAGCDTRGDNHVDVAGMITAASQEFGVCRGGGYLWVPDAPLASRVTAGQAADVTQLVPLLNQVAVCRPGGVGRPRRRPDSLTGDRAYGSKANRAVLRQRKIKTVIPQRRDQVANRLRKGSAGGRPPRFDVQHYKRRNQVERGYNRRKQP